MTSVEATTPANDDAAGAASAASYTLGEIAVHDAHKVFGVTRALDGCTLRARRGEIHAIVGENGCGKSTLAKAISGVLPLDAGTVSIFGNSPSSPHEARGIGIATVFQEVLVADEASVVDNLFVGTDRLWTRAMPRRQKREAAARLMEELTGGPVDPDTVVGTLPLSTKQWITIGRALLRNPTVLILDESSAALDLDATERLFAKMRECRDGGAAVFIVTHRIAELVRISDRATILRDGYDVGTLEGADITERNLLSMMTGATPATSAADKKAPEPVSDRIVLQSEGLQVWRDAEPLDFRLREGEIVGVAGLDGQGQDAFVRVLSGIARSIEGTPTVPSSGGETHTLNSLATAVHAGVAYVSGDRKREGILPNLSIHENLLIPQYRRHRFGGPLGIIQWQALSASFEREVDRFSIKMGDPVDRITSLSGGNQQKVMIGRAFALNPRILVLNDPARGIDIGSKDEIYTQLRTYAERGNSVIYLSSELEEFIGLCSRVIVFRQGTIFDEFEGIEVDTHRILEAMFGQTSGIGRHKQTESRNANRPQAIKVVDFSEEGSEMLTKDDIGPIKIKEFDRGKGTPTVHGRGHENRDDTRPDDVEPDSSPRTRDQADAARPLKILDFDAERAEEALRERVGSMKIVDVDREARRDQDRGRQRERAENDRPIGRIKIIESDP